MNARSTAGLTDLKQSIYYLDESTRAKLRKIADKNDMSMSQVIRFLVRQSPVILRNKRGERV